MLRFCRFCSYLISKMLPEWYKFTKTMDKRFSEYYELFVNSQVRVNHINKVWELYLKSSIVPSGWNALWVLSKEDCCELHLLHPTSIFVTVEHVDFAELRAYIVIEAVQDDIVDVPLPEKVHVPLKDLLPTKHQQIDVDLHSTADKINQLKYFFKYLWHPWDEDKNMYMMEWVEQHLKVRLELIQKENIYSAAVLPLIREAHNTQNMIDSSSEDMSQQQKLILIDKLQRMKYLETELELFEDVELRELVMEKYTWHEPQHFFIVENLNLKQLSTFLLKFQNNLGDLENNYKIFHSIEEVLKQAHKNDTLVLSPGVHKIVEIGNISQGGTIMGVENNSSTILTDKDACHRAVFLEVYGPFNLRNLSIERHTGTLIQIYLTEINLEHCSLSCEQAVYTRGVIVNRGCSLTLLHCDLVGFEIGIFMMDHSVVTMDNVRILCCAKGVKLTNNCTLSMSNVTFVNNDLSCVEIDDIEYEEEEDDHILGDAELLTDCPSHSIAITVNNISFENSPENPVVINRRRTINEFVIDS